MHPEIKRLILLVKEIGYLNIDILTNGSLLTDELSRFLAEIDVNVQVSLDGDEQNFSKMRNDGNFTSVINGIKNFRKFSKHINLSFVPTKLNYECWHNIIKISEELGINLIHLPFLEDSGRAKENNIRLGDSEFKLFLEMIIEEYYNGEYGNVHIYFIEAIQKRLQNNMINCSGRCSALNDNLSIDYNGNIFPCSELISNNFKIANLYELHTFDEIFKNKMVNTMLAFDVNNNTDCSSCIYKRYCSGGCRLNAILNGMNEEKDPNCVYTKFIFDKIFRHLI